MIYIWHRGINSTCAATSDPLSMFVHHAMGLPVTSLPLLEEDQHTLICLVATTAVHIQAFFAKGKWDRIGTSLTTCEFLLQSMRMCTVRHRCNQRNYAYNSLSFLSTLWEFYDWLLDSWICTGGCWTFGKGWISLGFQLAVQIFLSFYSLTSVCYTVVEEVLNLPYDQCQIPCYWICYALCRDFSTKAIALYCWRSKPICI